MRRALLLLALIARPLTAQTTDWARVTIGISGGVFVRTTLWDVANQQVPSGNIEPGTTPPRFYAPDTYQLHREVPTGQTLTVSATRFSSWHFGLTAELAFLGFKMSDDCTLVHDGGDPELATVCAHVGSDQKFGTVDPFGAHTDPSGEDYSAAATIVQGGVVIRPFKPAGVQPFVKAMIGFATTPRSTLAMASTYGEQGGVALRRIIYQDYGFSSARIAMTAAAGLTTAPTSGFQVQFEVRETFLPQAIVTGPTTIASLQPPGHSVLIGFPSLLVGVNVVLKRERGKRY